MASALQPKMLAAARRAPSTPREENHPMSTPTAVGLALAGILLLPLAGYAADGTDSAKTVVKDSVITTKIKAALAAEKVSSLVKIGVETDGAGAVVLTGSVTTQARSDKAAKIAAAVKGVTAVDNRIQIVADK
jgi:hyperosmotically inducible protein